MKTAVSLPDDLFKEAEAAAERLGISRSQLYSNALAEYLERKRGQRITQQLNEIYRTESSSLDPALAELQRRSLTREEW